MFIKREFVLLCLSSRATYQKLKEKITKEKAPSKGLTSGDVMFKIHQNFWYTLRITVHFEWMNEWNGADEENAIASLKQQRAYLIRFDISIWWSYCGRQVIFASHMKSILISVQKIWQIIRSSPNNRHSAQWATMHSVLWEYHIH